MSWTPYRSGLVVALALLVIAPAAWAVAPVITDVEVADVTTSSITLIWDVDQNPTADSIRVFGDAAATVDLTTDYELIVMPLIGGDPTAVDELANLDSRNALKAATSGKGLARVAVRGLTPATTYYLRARSAAGADSAESPAASTIEVTTANVNSFITRSQQLRLRFEHPDPTGWVVLATSPDTQYSVSGVVGDGALSNEAFLNLAQMFDLTGNNWEPVGETTVTLRIREGGGSLTSPSFDITFIDGFAVGIYYDIDISLPAALLEMILPASLTYTEGETIILAWLDELAPTSQVALYFDTDDTGADGTQIVAGLDPDVDGAGESYSWDTSTVADGVYWVYAQGSNGGPVSTSYAPAPVAIDRAGLDADVDTMADLWEQLFFGDLSNDGTVDTDLDGRADALEYADRTIPIQPDFRLRGVAGLNFVSWPVAPAPSLTSADLISQLGGIAESIQRIDNPTQLAETTTWDGGSAAGAVFPIVAEEGYMLRLAQAYDGVYAGLVSTADADLGVGVNLVGFNALPSGYSAYQLLVALGGDAVVASVARLDPDTGRFESAIFSGGDPVGFDFSVLQGESYLIHLNQAVNGFAP